MQFFNRSRLRGLIRHAFLLGCCMVFTINLPVHATEHGMGMYLLGSKGPLAGVVPAPGLYLQNDLYHYRARAGTDTKLPMGGEIGLGIKARALIDVPTLIWSINKKVLNGQPAFTLSQPIGQETIDADLVLGAQSGRFHGGVTTAGDPLASALLGWRSGAFHWNTSAMVNIPVGNYRKGSMANLAFNHWAVDLSVAGTWFDPKKGWDISSAMGMTFNGRNPATNYKSGRELHFEAALSKYLSPQFSLGVMGYHYQQVSKDKGEGAVLGSFKGRASAVGPTASYTFQVNQKPVSLRLKILREFNVRNRPKGTAGFLTLSFPLN